MRATKKYAVRFHEMYDFEQKSVFSEITIERTENVFYSVFDTASSLAEFVIQNSRTKELGKQLNAQKEALDAEIDNKIEQQRIRFIEEIKRMKIRMEADKKDMENEFRRMKSELAIKSKENDYIFEEVVKTNKVFHNIILKEKQILGDIHPIIESLAGEYSARREYILYCEKERESISLIDEYLKQMI